MLADILLEIEAEILALELWDEEILLEIEADGLLEIEADGLLEIEADGLLEIEADSEALGL